MIGASARRFAGWRGDQSWRPPSGCDLIAMRAAAGLRRYRPPTVPFATAKAQFLLRNHFHKTEIWAGAAGLVRRNMAQLKLPQAPAMCNFSAFLTLIRVRV